MCGIVGLAGVSTPNVSAQVQVWRDTMVHRGPDDCGGWTSTDRRVTFGHRRLAVIDLSPRAHQPMSNDVGHHLTYNGEIYNYLELRDQLLRAGHRFTSDSDTEVILQAYKAWGPACLERLDGMFAFGLYDEPRRTVLLARDRAGEKPLYYSVSSGRLVFASELKALLASGLIDRELDAEAFEHFLAYGFAPRSHSLIKGVQKLLPGSALTFNVDSGAASVAKYWELPRPNASESADPEALVGTLHRLLRESVARRLSADVPVGILLSGGIDSSLVAAIAAESTSTSVRTFTIAFPGHDTFDEAAHAQIVADHFGTRHAVLEAGTLPVDVLSQLAVQYDEPIGDSSIIPTFLVCRLVRQVATVALSGDGGDELFGGYSHYSALLRDHARMDLFPKSLARWIAPIAAWLPVGLRGRNRLLSLQAGPGQAVAHTSLYFDHRARARLLRSGGPVATTWRPEQSKALLCAPGTSLLRQATEADFLGALSEDFLVKVDRASMLNSLEVRAPWLASPIIDFAFSAVPDMLRTTSTRTKILPRLLAKRLLPKQLDLDRKQGFSIPLKSWLTGAWGDTIDDVLGSASADLFNRRTVASLIRNQRRGFANSSRLFALLMFELWRREYRVRPPQAGVGRLAA